MSYHIQIVDEQGRQLPGTILFYDETGAPMGKRDVPAGGIDLDFYEIGNVTTFHIDSPGYIGYDVTDVSGQSPFVLVKDNSNVLIIMLGLTVLGYLALKKLRR